MAKKYVGANSLYLAGSGSIVGATSITLTTFTDIYGNTLTMSDFGDLGYITFEPDTTNQEFATFTGVTANANTTFTLTGVKTVLAKSPYTQTSGLTRSHSGGTKVVISDSPAFWDTFANKNNTNTYDLVQTFTYLPESNGGNAINPTQLVTYGQALSMATGTASVNRTVVAGTAGETIAVDKLVYLKSSDGRWWLADAGVSTTDENVILGIAQGAGTAGNLITNGILTYGFNTFSSLTLTTNSVYYVSNTAGNFSLTPGTTEVTVGYSLSTTTMFFNPRYDQQITEDQQDALVGTSGIPSSTNKYVTDADTSATASGSKVMRWNGGAFPAGNGSAITNMVVSSSFTAAESITAGQPVSAYFYQSDGGILFDAKTTHNTSIGSGGGTDTIAFTVGNNSNRALVVFVNCGASGGAVSNPTVTYNGVSMTLVNTVTVSSSQTLSAFVLANPATGTNNVVVTLGASAVGTTYVSTAVTSYYNTSGLATYASAAADWVSYTTPALGMLLVSGCGGNTGTSSVNNNNNYQTGGTNSFSTISSADSGIAYTSSNATVIYTGPTSIIVIGLTAFTTPTYGYVVKSSAATPANGVNLNKYTTFAGFAQSTVSAGQSVAVITDGGVTGLSGLTPLSTYYLADTAGTIATTAGTNSKKVGFATLSTTLLMKDTI